MDYYSRGSFSLCEYSGDSEAAVEAEEYWFLPPHAAAAAVAVPEDNVQLEAAEGSSSDAESGCYGDAWPWPPTDMQVDDDEDAADAAVLPGTEGTSTSLVRGWTRAGVFTVVGRFKDGTTGAACDDLDDGGSGDAAATWTGRSAEEYDRREDDRLFWESCLQYGYSADS